MIAVSNIGLAEVIDKPADIIKAVQAGKEGAWLDTPALKKCLAADINQKNLSEQLENCDATTDILRHEIDLYKGLTVIINEQNKILSEKDELNKRLRMEYNLELDKWYRKPYITILLGVGLGIVTTAVVGAVLVVKLS